jgi:CubicO group peptidase (beta-lactamase class C family)
MRRLLTGLACVLLVATTMTSAQQPIFTPYGILPVLDAYLEALRQQAGIPGMSAAIVRDGAILWEKGYGFQNLQTRERATPSTPYVIGDASGTLAAILLLQCAEQRLIDLDQPLGQYGIDIPERNATLRDILSHRQADAETDFLYSPQRYGQLTAVTEWCIPQPYRKSVSHRIINRLAMIDSVPGTDLKDPNIAQALGEMYDEAELERYRRVLDRLAVGYKVEAKNRADRTELAPIPMTAAGGLVTTVRDLAKLDGALDRRLLLLDDTLGKAWNPTIGAHGAPIPMGLGWFVQSYGSQRVVWHFGIVPNAYSSLIIKVPERNLTFVLLANSDKLAAPFQLPAGDVSRSLFATLFLKLVT